MTVPDLSRSDQCWCRAHDAVWRSLAGVTVVTRRGSEDPITLRGGADLLWRALEVPGTPADLIDDVVAVVPGVSVSALREAFLELSGRGLVVRE
ncbi:MAG: hypothetical protein ACR2P0_01190 [Acidimicrobiales bacterium]